MKKGIISGAGFDIEMYHLECKYMLKEDDRFIMGEGRAELLRLVESSGSISKAAEKMDMSYRHAWGKIKDIEKALGEEIVESNRGGEAGGGTRLSKKGKQLLKDYQELKKEQTEKNYKKPSLTVDGIITEGDNILLIERKNPPFQGRYALPGGFVEYGEKVEEAVIREVEEETGLITEIEELVGVYSDPDRDPRGHTVSSVFSLKKVGGKLSGGSDAAKAEYFPKTEMPELAFDHRAIIEDHLVISGD